MTDTTFQDFSIEFKNKIQIKKELSFEIKGHESYGLDKSIINGIRRSLLMDIDTCAIKQEDIVININKTALHNEFLTHRISLIPLYVDPKSVDRYLLFELKVKCNDVDIKNITVDMFEIYRLNKESLHQLKIQEQMDYLSDEDNMVKKLEEINKEYYDMDKPLSDIDKKKLFRPFEFNKMTSYFLLTELKKLNSDEDYEEIELYGITSIGTGKIHSQYNNLPTVLYTFKRDDKMFQKVLGDKIKINKIKDVDRYTKELYISESERYFYRDNQNEPYWYTFKITSNHYYDSKEVFIQTIDNMISNLENIDFNLKNILDEELDENIYKYETVKDNIYKITLQNQDDTMGNIIQSHMCNKFITKETIVQFCGYKRPHPLTNEIFFKVMIKQNEHSENQRKNLIIGFFNNTIKDLVEIFNQIKIKANKQL